MIESAKVSNYALYGDISNRVMETLKNFSPNIEVYSIDEMFLSMEGINKNMNEYGQKIKKTIWQHIRMPVGVGVAPTKTLAKLANHAAKKIPKCNGVCVLDSPHKWEWLLARLPTNKVWGVGRKLALKLENHNIVTALALAQSDKKRINKIGGVCLERTSQELNGIACLELEEVKNKKQIYSTRSFGEKVTTLAALQEAISLYAITACEKLRKQNQRVKTINVFLHTSPFLPNYYANSTVVQLPFVTDDSRVVVQYAKYGIEKIYRENKHYLKAGVGLLELVDKACSQRDLFCHGQGAQMNAVMSVLDGINHKYGAGTIFIAAQGINKPWAMRQNFKSPAYTTSWKQLPTVKV